MSAPRLRANDPRLPVLHALLASGACAPTRKQLAELSGVSLRSVMNVIRDAARVGVLRREPLGFGPSCGLVLSVALGSESMRAGLLDANGELHHKRRLTAMPGQLELAPDLLLGRIRKVASQVMSAAIEDPRLRVGGRDGLPMLGVNVAWPVPINRAGYPAGRVLSHIGWHTPRPGDAMRLNLRDHIAAVLGRPFSEHMERVSAMNDANTDALAVAFDHARSRARA